jgi:hypothetical protein
MQVTNRAALLLGNGGENKHNPQLYFWRRETNGVVCMIQGDFATKREELHPPLMHQRFDFHFHVSLDSEMYLLLISQFRFLAARVRSMNVLR